MPIKHQSDSYRTRAGIKYICWRDVLDGVMSDLRTSARNDVASFRARGFKAFYEISPDKSYYRVFVEERYDKPPEIFK